MATRKFVTIAQNLNTANPRIRYWLVARRVAPLDQLVQRLLERGCDYLDLMLTHPGLDPMAVYPWLVDTLQRHHPHVRFALDVSDLRVLETVIPRCQHPPLLNGLLGWPLDEALLGLLDRHRIPVIVPCATRETVQLRTEERLEIAYFFYRTLKQLGRADNEIFFDAQLFPLEPPVPGNRPWDTLDTIGRLRRYFPGCHIVIGLENLTFRNPRKLALQTAFLSMALDRGLSAVIYDPLKAPLWRVWHAAQQLVPDGTPRSTVP